MALGCHIGRKLQYAFGLPLADAATFTALQAEDERHLDGCLCVKLDDSTLWVYDTASAAALGPDVLDSTYGAGQWLRAGGAGSLGVGAVNIKSARYATTGALAAYTRTGNVILADAVGALGAIDGVTGAVGEVLFLKNGAAGADNGLYRIDVIGAAGAAYQMTRIGGADASAEVTAGMLVYVSEGTTLGNEWWYLTTDDPIVLNTTPLAFIQVPSLADLASTAGAGLIGVLDTATRITGTTVETATAELAGRVFIPVADDAAVIAVTAAQRVDGMLVVKLDDMTLWTYDLGSAAGASDWVQVPTAGAGRWLRVDAPAGLLLPPVADNAALVALAAINRVDGSIVVQLDTMGVWKYDLGSAAAASDWVVAPTDGTGRWLDVGNPSGGLVLPAVADNAALLALAAVDRQDGSIVVQLDTMQTWKYDLGSAAAVSDWVIEPTDTVGRWLDVGYPDGGLVLPPVADNAALIALTAVDRQDGSLVVQFDTMYCWRYDLGSAVAADAWTIAPTDGVGRWVRTDIAVADAIGVTAVTGGELVGQYDPNAVLAAATVGAATRENATALDVHRPGVPMINRIICIGAEPIAGTDEVIIGADTYEFNTNTPPDVAGGGTAGSIWVYQGANSAQSRANLINAINFVIDAPTISRAGVETAADNVELVVAVAGTTLGTIDIRSSATIGGAIIPSTDNIACTETLTVGTDIWDDATMYAGLEQVETQQQSTTVTLTAAMITATFLEIEYDFTPTAIISVFNRNRPACPEAATITADRVVLTLAGGGAPNHQAGDVVDVTVQG